MGKKVLVIAAHPDDELMGCGGTVALHTADGDQVQVVIACEGESLRYKKSDNVNQAESVKKVAELLGVQRVHHLQFPDQRLDTYSLVEIITPLENAVSELEPEIVYCQYGGDINRDHKILFEAMLVAARPLEGSIRAVYAFDTASSTEWAYPRTFMPDTWVDISSVLEKKMEAMACYESELRDYPHPRSLDSLRYRAHFWGNAVCCGAAEVFMTVRRVYRDGQTPL